VPAVFLSGGPMATGQTRTGRRLSLASVFEAVSATHAGTMSRSELFEIETHACPSCGSCSGLFTANSMNCLVEALGLGRPGNGTAPALSPEREMLAERAGKRIVTWVAERKTARRVVTRSAMLGAIALDMALGCSTNTVLHLLAAAREGNIELSLDDFDRQ